MTGSLILKFGFPNCPGRFFHAHNLEIITPSWLQFQILTKGAIAMREEALIDYQIRLRGIPLRWRTRIEVWNPPGRFIDVQVRGPYQRWQHEHIFELADNGTFVWTASGTLFLAAVW